MYGDSCQVDLLITIELDLHIRTLDCFDDWYACSIRLLDCTAYLLDTLYSGTLWNWKAQCVKFSHMSLWLELT